MSAYWIRLRVRYGTFDVEGNGRTLDGLDATCSSSSWYVGRVMSEFGSDGSFLPDELRASAELMMMTTEMAGVAVWEYDFVRDTMSRSANHDTLYGMDWQIPWHSSTFLNATHEDDRAASDRTIQDCLLPGGSDDYEFDFRVIWPDESVHWLWVKGRVVHRDSSGRGDLIRGVIVDVTDRKEAEERAAHLTHLYATLSACNQAIVQSSSQDELFRRICHDVVEVGAASMAWISALQPDSGDVEPIASYGEHARAFLEFREAQIRSSGAARFDLATRAAREGRPVWSRERHHVPADVLARKAAEFGWRSSSAIPFRRGDAIVGTLTLYSGDEEFFSDEMDRLLQELSGDVSFALDAIDRGRERDRTLEHLRLADARMQTILHQSIVGIYIVQDSKFVFVNERAATVLGGASPGDVIGTRVDQHVPADQRKEFDALIERLEAGFVDRTEYEFDYERPDGTRVRLLATAVRANYDGRVARVGMIQEVPRQAK